MVTLELGLEGNDALEELIGILIKETDFIMMTSLPKNHPRVEALGKLGVVFLHQDASIEGLKLL